MVQPILRLLLRYQTQLKSCQNQLDAKALDTIQSCIIMACSAMRNVLFIFLRRV